MHLNLKPRLLSGRGRACHEVEASEAPEALGIPGAPEAPDAPPATEEPAPPTTTVRQLQDETPRNLANLPQQLAHQYLKQPTLLHPLYWNPWTSIQLSL